MENIYSLISVDEKTWAFEAQMPDGDYVRFFVLDGSERALVIDSGFLPLDIRQMAADVLAQEGRLETADGKEKPILLANTHADMDHTGGNGSFSSYYISAADYEMSGMREKFPDATWIPAEEGTRIDLGDRKLRYIMAPGHTVGNTVILDETNRILFPGDIVQTGTMFMFGAHRRPELLEASLVKLQGLKGEFDRIYSCHGEIPLASDAVDQTLACWRKVLAGEVTPTPAIAFDQVAVDRYDCGFCRFFCQKADAENETTSI